MIRRLLLIIGYALYILVAPWFFGSLALISLGQGRRALPDPAERRTLT